MERRAFLRLLSRAAAAVGIAAYVPSFPVPPEIIEKAIELEPALLFCDEINALVRKHILPIVVDNYFRPSPFASRLSAPPR